MTHDRQSLKLRRPSRLLPRPGRSCLASAYITVVHRQCVQMSMRKLIMHKTLTREDSLTHKLRCHNKSPETPAQSAPRPAVQLAMSLSLHMKWMICLRHEIAVRTCFLTRLATAYPPSGLYTRLQIKLTCLFPKTNLSHHTVNPFDL